VFPVVHLLFVRKHGEGRWQVNRRPVEELFLLLDQLFYSVQVVEVELPLKADSSKFTRRKHRYRDPTTRSRSRAWCDLNIIGSVSKTNALPLGTLISNPGTFLVLI